MITRTYNARSMAQKLLHFSLHTHLLRYLGSVHGQLYNFISHFEGADHL